MTAADKECLGCTLPICDDRSKECRFVQIIGSKDRTEYFAKVFSRKYVPVEIDGRTLPQAKAKEVATKKRNRTLRMRAALKRRDALNNIEQ